MTMTLDYIYTMMTTRCKYCYLLVSKTVDAWWLNWACDWFKT